MEKKGIFRENEKNPPRPFKISMDREKQSRSYSLPPSDWFTGFGFEDTGILLVLTSGKFWDLQNGEVGRKWGMWCKLQDPDHPAPDTAEHCQRLEEIETELTGLLGFSPRQILEFRNILARNYAGRFEAPFKIRLTRTDY